MQDNQWKQLKFLVRAFLYPVIIFGVVWIFASLAKRAYLEPAQKAHEQSIEDVNRVKDGRIESIGLLRDSAYGTED